MRSMKRQNSIDYLYCAAQRYLIKSPGEVFEMWLRGKEKKHAGFQ